MLVCSLCLVISTPSITPSRQCFDENAKTAPARSSIHTPHVHSEAGSFTISQHDTPTTASFWDNMSDPLHTLLSMRSPYLSRRPQPRHLQPRPHHRPRKRADTPPPAVHEAEREAPDGGVYGYDIYAAVSSLHRAVRHDARGVMKKGERGREGERGNGKGMV